MTNAPQPTAAAIARLLGVHRSTVARWFKRRVPAERVLDVEATTGVSRHVLRPDLYGPKAAICALQPLEAMS